MKKKKKEYKEVIEFLKTPRGKATLFFGFYFIFFVILIGMFRSVDMDKYDNDKTENELPFSIDNIVSGNYYYKYSFVIDDKEYVYEGKKDGHKEEFTYSNTKYFGNDGIYLINKSNIWVKEENPFVMKEYIDTNNIEKIAKKASFISKTEYESGMRVYSYKISTTTLLKLLENNKVDLDDVENEVIFKTDSDNEVNDVKYDLSSYCKYKNIASSSCKIELEYSKFGKVKNIKEPE